MLDKTRKSSVSSSGAEMLRSFAALEKAHTSIGRTLARIAQSAVLMQRKTAAIHEYTQRNLAEVLGALRSRKLPSGGTIAYRTIAGRMSCGDEERPRLFERLKVRGLHHCINYNPSINEGALAEEFENNPGLKKELQQEFPSFTVGETYRQLTLTFPGVEWKIQGNIEKGDYAPVPPDKKKKAA